MLVGVLDDDYQLDSRAAVTIRYADLFALASGSSPSDGPHVDELLYVPRIPIDAAEAKAMLAMTTVFADATNPSAEVRTYAGYTNAELSGGRSYVRVSHDGEAELT